MYEAKLMEELPFNDPSEIRTPAFNGQSSSGNVTAQFVYANFGREQDYDDLEQNHVEFRGKIAIVKYGMVYRGAKMSTAAARGLGWDSGIFGSTTGRQHHRRAWVQRIPRRTSSPRDLY